MDQSHQSTVDKVGSQKEQELKETIAKLEEQLAQAGTVAAQEEQKKWKQFATTIAKQQEEHNNAIQDVSKEMAAATIKKAANTAQRKKAQDERQKAKVSWSCLIKQISWFFSKLCFPTKPTQAAQKDGKQGEKAPKVGQPVIS